MHRGLDLRSSLPAVCLLALAVLPVYADPCFHLDFDDDNNPWTLRTQMPPGVTEGVVRFVFEAPAVLPSGQEFYWDVMEGCCNDMFQFGHVGAGLDPMSLTFDPAFVAYYEPLLPTCTLCCPWVIYGTFAGDMQAVAGQRYFIGEAAASARCEDFPPPCYPPQEFQVRFSPAALCGETTSDLMVFLCPTSGLPEEPAEAARSWGRIKARYRSE